MLIPEGWITVEQAASFLGVSTATIRRRVSAGIIPAKKFGRRTIRIDRDKLLPSFPSARRATPQ